MRAGNTSASHATAGTFVPFKLFDERGEARSTFRARLRGDALPVEQEAHEIRGGNRLYFRAQRADGVAVDACEQAALAPLGIVRPAGELATQYKTFAFELQQRRIDLASR